MDTVKSFKGYGKVNEEEDQKFRQATRKRIIIISVSLIILVIIAGIAIGLVVSKHNDESMKSSPASMATSIKAICSITLYPDSCVSSISSAQGSNSTRDPKQLFVISMNVAADEIARVSALADTFKLPSNDKRLELAIRDCKQLFSDSIDQFKDSVAALKDGLNEETIRDIRTWLSAAVTYQETCLDGFEGTTGDFKDKLESEMTNSTQFTSNSLAIATGILKFLDKLKHFKIHRKLLAVASESEFPNWVSSGRRRILQQSVGQLTPNVTVASDGSGQVKTIKEAVDLVPKKNEFPFLIYVKAGVYAENVVLDKNKWNVVVYGDGMHKTIIDGKLNFIDGTPTFSTATFITAGKKFMARDIGFKNSAGPEKHQAVALRSGSDLAVFYRCSFEGFQDTLYAHSHRQFYRDCDITGTIDFIFGDAAVILQNCNIRPRQALPNQQNTITAQGKKDPNEDTGMALQGCTITPYDNVTVRTYLGRPWKDYSTTVIMQSEIGSVVHSAGWLPWVIGVAPPSTIKYGEYRNTGPGAEVGGRVNWEGYKPSLSDEEASLFTVETFLKGSEWIQGTGVEFQSSLGQ